MSLNMTHKGKKRSDCIQVKMWDWKMRRRENQLTVNLTRAPLDCAADSTLSRFLLEPAGNGRRSETFQCTEFSGKKRTLPYRGMKWRLREQLYTPVRTTEISKRNNAKCWQGCDTPSSLPSLPGHLENTVTFSNGSMHLPYDPEITAWSIYPK